MARNTRTRRTKHRGNAAGMIESRGRTGRKPTATEKGSSDRGGGSRGSSSGSRKNRFDKPPTWKSAAVRAVVAAAIVYAISTVLLNKHTSPLNDLILVPIVLIVYMPMIYYTDLFLYRRRLRKKAEAR